MERNSPFHFLSQRTKKQRRRVSFSRVSQLRPHPNPLPKGEGANDDVAALSDIDYFQTDRG